MEFLYIRNVRAFTKTIKKPSTEHPSALLMAHSHLPFTRDHLYLVFAAVRDQLASAACNLTVLTKI